MNYPEYVEVNNKRYKINTDFRIAIECDQIGKDETIGDYERALAIIYKLFGDEGLKDIYNHNKLMELALKYLLCGKEFEKDDEDPNMDFVQDMDFIETSFMSDYGIDLSVTNMHWWKFYNLICGLSNNEFGNCCILNKIRNLRDTDINEIKDPKQKEKIRKAKEDFALKNKTSKVKNKFTEEQQKNINIFCEKIGL